MYMYMDVLCTYIQYFITFRRLGFEDKFLLLRSTDLRIPILVCWMLFISNKDFTSDILAF